MFLVNLRSRKVGTLLQICGFLSMACIFCTVLRAQGVQDFDYMLKRAKQGYADDQFRIGQAFEFGRGVERNAATAAEWYIRAAGAGDPRAQTEIATMYLSGVGVNQSETEAIRWLRQAASSDYLPAEFQLGTLYLLRRGVNPDEKEALRWIMRAASHGYHPAQVNLGIMYWNGLGVPADKTAAIQFFHKAADDQFAPAEFLLGNMYTLGTEVPKNLLQAIEWYKRAAGHGFACANLARLFARETPDYAQAYFWTAMTSYCTSEPGAAPDEFRQNVREHLTSRDILEIDSQVQDWLKNHQLVGGSVEFTNLPNNLVISAYAAPQ